MLCCRSSLLEYWLRNKTKTPGFLNIGKGDNALNNRYDKFFSNPGIDVPFGKKKYQRQGKQVTRRKEMAAQQHPDATALHPSRPTPQNSKLKSPAEQHDIVSQTDQRTTTKLHYTRVTQAEHSSIEIREKPLVRDVKFVSWEKP